jgi:hypothetical protein
MTKEQELQEFYELALECKQFLKEHNIETLTDTLAGHMAIFIRKKTTTAPSVKTPKERRHRKKPVYLQYGKWKIKLEQSQKNNK